MTLFGLPALVQVVAPIAYLVGDDRDAEQPQQRQRASRHSGGGRLAPKRSTGRSSLLGVIVMLAVALSHHVLAPASLATFARFSPACAPT